MNVKYTLEYIAQNKDTSTTSTNEVSTAALGNSPGNNPGQGGGSGGSSGGSGGGPPANPGGGPPAGPGGGPPIERIPDHVPQHVTDMANKTPAPSDVGVAESEYRFEHREGVPAEDAPLGAGPAAAEEGTVSTMATEYVTVTQARVPMEDLTEAENKLENVLPELKNADQYEAVIHDCPLGAVTQSDIEEYYEQNPGERPTDENGDPYVPTTWDCGADHNVERAEPQ